MYASRSLKPAEKNYPVFELEALAVVWAIKQFRQYLFNTKFSVVTDHAALQYILKKTNPSPRICRWGLALQEYDFDVKHRPGVKNSNVDALSRLCSLSLTVSLDEPLNLKITQESDTFCSSLINLITLGVIPEDPDLCHRLLRISHTFDVLDGVLIFIGNRNLEALPVVPESVRDKILEHFHDHILSGHLGFKKTFEKIYERYYWPRMYSEIKKYCENCKLCLSRKSPSHPNKAGLVPITVSEPFELLASDIIGPLPLTEDGNKYIIVFTEYLTKYTIACAIPDVTALTVAKKFVNEVILKHGAPTKLLSDQGANFTSQLISEICKLCSVRKIQTSPYHPQCDGLVERFNKTLATMISMYVNNNHND